MEATITHEFQLSQTDGDLWYSTQLDDEDTVYSWGDGEGILGDGDRLNNGMLRIQGALSDYLTTSADPITIDADNIVAHDIPTGVALPLIESEKICSLLYYDGVLYAGIEHHTRSRLFDPDKGYIATSTDYGVTWTEVASTPWTGSSNFRCPHFVNMGSAYSAAQDDYVYVFGIGRPRKWDGPVYLARVAKTAIDDYSAYYYYTSAGLWSATESEAAAIDGLSTTTRPSAVYHQGLKQYFFYGTSGLFVSDYLWTGWEEVDVTIEDEAAFATYYMPGLLTTDEGPEHIYFAVAGVEGSELDYKFNIGRIEFYRELEEPEWEEPEGEEEEDDPPPSNPTTPWTEQSIVVPRAGSENVVSGYEWHNWFGGIDFWPWAEPAEDYTEKTWRVRE